MHFLGQPFALYGSQRGAVGSIKGCMVPTVIAKRAPSAKRVPPGRKGGQLLRKGGQLLRKGGQRWRKGDPRAHKLTPSPQRDRKGGSLLNAKAKNIGKVHLYHPPSAHVGIL